MNRTIFVTVCNDPRDLGPTAAADDVTTFLALVDERLALLFQGATVTIETSVLEGTFVADSEGEEIEILDAIQATWESWHLGERADADETGTTLCEVST